MTDARPSRIYNDLAHLFPLITPVEDYALEAGFWLAALRDKLGPGRHEILELGVGAGHNLHHFADQFNVEAVDLSPRMLEQSRRLNPSVTHHIGDMRSVRLNRRFDAVLIHDAVNHLLTEDDIRATLATVAAHLRPAGIFITTPDRFKETFVSPQTDHSTHSDGRTTLTYFEYAFDPDPLDTSIETIMTFFILEGRSLRIEQDHFRTGLFPKRTWIDLIAEAGFAVEERPCRGVGVEGEFPMFVGTMKEQQR